MTSGGARRPYPEHVPPPGPPPLPERAGPDDGLETAEQIVEHLFALVDRLRGGFETAVARFELSAAQAKALRYLAGAGPVPMRELAQRLRCDASNVTGLVDRLEQRGLVERRAAPTDRRVKSLVVTPAGAEIARTMWSHVVTGAVPMVGLAEEDQAMLLVLLRRLDHGPSAQCWITAADRTPQDSARGRRRGGGAAAG